MLVMGRVCFLARPASSFGIPRVALRGPSARFIGQIGHRVENPVDAGGDAGAVDHW